MGAWGFKLFQSDHDLDIIGDLDVKAGLDKLQLPPKEQNPGDVSTDEDSDEDDGPRVHTLYYPKHPEIIRKHLDSGILVQLFEKYEIDLYTKTKTTMWDNPGYELMILAASAMEVGCNIPDKHRKVLEKVYMCVDLPAGAVAQMKAALSGPNAYQNGTPYHFDSLGLIDTMNAPRPPGVSGGFNVHGPGTLFYKPPQGTKAGLMELNADYVKEHNGKEVCSACGVDEEKAGKPLLVCGGCKTRKYCDKECQKTGWKMHKGDCMELRKGEGAVATEA